MDYTYQFPVEKMCKVFEVSRSGYYKWLKNSNKRYEKMSKLDLLIKDKFEISRFTYGSPRIAIEVNKGKQTYSKSTIARRMTIMGLKARRKKKYTITTQSNHNFKIAPNHLDRQFDVEKLSTVWVSDITYLRVKQHWLYLTTIIDLADRMVIGWSLSESMDAESTVIKAFNNACHYRAPSKGFMFHSDRGVQYACNDFKKILSKWKAKQSMSRKGNCWDNAVAESFFKTIKVECIYQHNLTSDSQAYSIVFDYINGWYNTVRIHTALGGKSPLQICMEKSKYLYAAA